jgi:hypothetical protein
VQRESRLFLLAVLLVSGHAFGKAKRPEGRGKTNPGETAFLYQFGYETPETRKRNQKFGDDGEESGAVFIIAKDEAAALAWGQEISEWFVRKLFADPKVSWKRDRFAFWIEHKPDTIEAARRMKPQAPTVRQGEYPRFEQMRPRGR